MLRVIRCVFCLCAIWSVYFAVNRNSSSRVNSLQRLWLANWFHTVKLQNLILHIKLYASSWEILKENSIVPLYTCHFFEFQRISSLPHQKLSLVKSLIVTCITIGSYKRSLAFYLEEPSKSLNNWREYYWDWQKFGNIKEPTKPHCLRSDSITETRDSKRHPQVHGALDPRETRLP